MYYLYTIHPWNIVFLVGFGYVRLVTFVLEECFHQSFARPILRCGAITLNCDQETTETVGSTPPAGCVKPCPAGHTNPGDPRNEEHPRRGIPT